MRNIFTAILSLVMMNELLYASEANEQFKKLEVPNLNCKFVLTKFTEVNEDTTIPLNAKIEKLIQISNEFRPVTIDNKILIEALREEPELNYKKSLELCNSDCYGEKNKIVKILLSLSSDSKISKSNKEKITNQLKTIILKKTCPTYMAFLLKTNWLQLGEKNNLWKIKINDSINLYGKRDQLKLDLKKTQPKYNELLTLIENMQNSSLSLKKNKRFQNLKYLIAEESEKAAGLLSIVEKINFE